MCIINGNSGLWLEPPPPLGTPLGKGRKIDKYIINNNERKNREIIKLI
ncbi:MAG: hypothetical protein Q8S84_03575 [bacterium]|nr:hypothetical protein [bacterium]